jgi:hypothetical protein
MHTAPFVFAALFPLSIAVSLREHSPESQNSGRAGYYISNDAVKDWFYNTHPSLQPKGKNEFAAAQLASQRGTPLLLQEAAKTFSAAGHDVFDFAYERCTVDFHKHVDVFIDNKHGWAPLIKWFQDHREGIPIVKLGWCDPTNMEWQGFGHEMFGEPWRSVRQQMQGRKFSGLSVGNENWGLFSAWHPNRTINWGSGIQEETLSDIRSFLDDPSLLAFLHMQHNDVPHPKVINFPIAHFKRSWGWMKDTPSNHQTHLPTLNSTTSQTHLLSQYGSHWSYRQIVFEQFQSRFGVDFHWGSSKGHGMIPEDYMDALANTKFHAVPSGLGVDCYSLWETIAAGSIPIVERGFGMDSLLGQLPVLSVDSFADVSKEFLHAVHPYFLMHASDFNWALLRRTTWLDGMHGSSEFIAGFLDFRLPPSSNTYLDSKVKPTHCVAEKVTVGELFHDRASNAPGTDPDNCCAARPIGDAVAKNAPMFNSSKVHPWAWGFKGAEETIHR